MVFTKGFIFDFSQKTHKIEWKNDLLLKLFHVMRVAVDLGDAFLASSKRGWDFFVVIFQNKLQLGKG